MTEQSYATSIRLPDENAFRNLNTARRFAIDIGGSLAKLAYTATVQRKTSMVSEDSEEDGSIYQVSDTDETIVRLHFIKFETKFIETCLDFIQAHFKGSSQSDRSVKVTGGGAYKYTDLISSKLSLRVDREDEMCCLIKGCNFLLKNIPDEVFIYQRHGSPEYRFQGVTHNIFPYLLVNIGSGVSLIKVESEKQFERIGGTATGGGTFWGLGSLLTEAKTFDELLQLAERGDHRNVDMLVKDIYGGAYPLIGLPADLIASSFGKAARSPRQGQATEENVFKEEDVARSLLLSISNDIGQIAYLHAQLHGLKKIYFGGYFIRGHPLTMHTITYAINYWSKGGIQPLFLRHEGYLGAIGAFLKGAEEDESYSWEENFAGSSGLAQSSHQLQPFNSKFDKLELDRLEKVLLPCPLLASPDTYLPDTVDLTQDIAAQEYWLQCFTDSIDKQEEQAIKSQTSHDLADVKLRAGKFKQEYLHTLETLKSNPCAYGSLNVRGLLDMRSHCLKEFNFTDPYSQQKQFENEHALKYLTGRLQDLDGIEDAQTRILELARGFLAGNVFDWGAKEVADIMEKGEFQFKDAESRLQDRPWLMDDFDAWVGRLSKGPVYRCVAVFCDNSGADIILGVFPFVRDLLMSGSKVILCANTKPTLNDVIYQELLILVRRVASMCPVIASALDTGQLMVMASGQGSPCLDLRLIDSDLVQCMTNNGTDLVVIEGMGRAIHTNFDARFSCDVLKVAVLKNRWLAQRLGGDMFNVVFKFEQASKSLGKNRICDR
ncbi:4'-phosphopantetheine phosphatase-like [Mya arenaria]|uniref:4'-phosphopantetheine phosphatase-like n=1 Tax=Mya arenaria TaxID=6604 RepID=UPI0022E28760|nr:4'-phosphopantetheine phosphatase-like [Mya arenaria]XP_052782703.1 4'-phosphopantetheine phosphatase-like [Mya arenaria]